MEHKTANTFELKAGDTGEFSATFSLFGGPPDEQGDITEHGAFTDGVTIPVASFGHVWATNPIGVATIHTDRRGAQAEGRLFVETSHGRDAFLTLRGLGEQGRWSYGFSILDSEPGTWEGRPIRRLRQIQVHEVSPVLLPAQPRTATNWMKGQPLTPQQRALLRIKADLYRRQLPALKREIAQLEAIEAERDKFYARGWLKR